MNAIAHAVTAGMSHDEASILDSLLDDIIEAAPLEATSAVAEEHEIAAIEGAIERAEASEAFYAEAETDAIASPADAPKTTTIEKKAKSKKAKPEGESKKAKLEGESVPRVTRHSCHGHESRVLASRLGEKLGEFLVLEVADAGLDATALKVRQDEILAVVDELAKKVGEKATMLFSYMANGGKLNEVLARAFKVLARDGKLTSGNKGNLQTDLLEKPFSAGTSASQSNQIFMLFPALKITTREKGCLMSNPDSLILMKMNAELGLSN